MTTKKKSEGKRAVAEREGAANDIAAYVVAVLERQLDAGAGKHFETREHFAGLGRSITRKVNDFIDRQSQHADEEEKGAETRVERKPSEVFVLLEVTGSRGCAP